jgi:DNA adenine methylase
MKYLGGKHRNGRFIANVMIRKCPPEKAINGYLEPFCGSLGVFKHMTDKNYSQCTASDIQPDLIALWKGIQKDSFPIPEHITEKEYNELKSSSSKKPNPMRAIAGFFLSFGGKYFAGYAQKWNGKTGRNYMQEFRESVEKIQPAIQKDSVIFINQSYRDFHPRDMLIYCDPPYRGTETYSGVNEPFDHDIFWETMRKWSKDNCVFISEESAPPDFQSVWSKAKRRTIDKENQTNKKEQLFMYKPSSKNKTMKRRR